jgi:hypothetical protein
MNHPPKGLVNVLIAKSIAETVLIGTFAVLFFIDAFPPFFHGWGEATPGSIAGWVVNDAAPWDRVQVQLYIDDEFIADGLANKSRPDVLATRWARDEWHGYEFQIPAFDVGEHEAKIYAMHMSGRGRRRTLQLVGDPIRFRRNEDGTLTDLNLRLRDHASSSKGRQVNHDR